MIHSKVKRWIMYEGWPSNFTAHTDAVRFSLTKATPWGGLSTNSAITATRLPDSHTHLTLTLVLTLRRSVAYFFKFPALKNASICNKQKCTGLGQSTLAWKVIKGLWMRVLWGVRGFSQHSSSTQLWSTVFRWSTIILSNRSELYLKENCVTICMSA